MQSENKAKITRVLIGRVFDWGQYKNLRLSFELNVEGLSEPDTNRAILEAFEKLAVINDVLFRSTRLYETLLFLDVDYTSTIRSAITTANRHFNKHYKEWECLNHFAEHKEIKEDCEDVIGAKTLTIAKQRAKELEEIIEKINKTRRFLLTAEEKKDEFKKKLEELIDELKTNFANGNFQEAQETIRKAQDVIDEVNKVYEAVKYYLRGWEPYMLDKDLEILLG